MLRVTPAAALALVLLASPFASAGPIERLREFFATVNTILADPETEDQPLERVARIRGLVAGVSAVEAAAAGALGREWQARSPAEQEEFVGLFAELLERAYVGRLAGTARVSNGVRVDYLNEAMAGDEASVLTALDARNGGKALIEYQMVSRRGRWRIRDLVLDGVSIIDNYHAQFRRILRDVSFQELVGLMRAKLSEASFMFARGTGRSASSSGPALTAPVQLARLDDEDRDSNHHPAAGPAAAPLRSRDIGWSMGPASDRSAPGTTVKPAYWVQVAAFKTAAAAERLAERLDAGTIVSASDGRLLLVRVGPFVEEGQAVSKREELEALGHRPFVADAGD